MIDLRIKEPREDQWIMTALVGLDDPFTRSNGTVIARIYERLTKASRRRVNNFIRENDGDGFGLESWREDAYRQGVYDAFKALQDELNA